ncbi:hypothetical protein SO802_018932 [Lithocarpus litseifolius]|uniref:DUF4283 domain-containing protein n=1 Tax=Lithocarpus litseifolius TaxID=425828 RepID=A0AAW2CQ33_9ROSI
MERSRARSLEEENELARSTKKDKDSHNGVNEDSPGRREGPCHVNKLSFKDKLMGEIPGAYSQSLAFSDQMEAESDSDEEFDDIREGLTKICLSKETKQRIRAPWAKALIVKVFGRTVGYNFLHAKLLSLWKPTGRLDMVDLGRDFYLLRFAVRDDLEMVLMKGPWFISEQFLSIRRWEANFKPSEAQVSSVAVWVRLNELPIEYYDGEVLREIGNALGKVLRVDTHTAIEARGRYARLCVQVDAEARDTLEGGQSEVAYGPWMVVTRKKKDNRGAMKSSVSSLRDNVLNPSAWSASISVLKPEVNGEFIFGVNSNNNNVGDVCGREDHGNIENNGRRDSGSSNMHVEINNEVTPSDRLNLETKERHKGSGDRENIDLVHSASEFGGKVESEKDDGTHQSVQSTLNCSGEGVGSAGERTDDGSVEFQHCGLSPKVAGSRKRSVQRNHGLDLATILALPVFSYHGDGAKYLVDCAICLSEFEENEDVKAIRK